MLKSQLSLVLLLMMLVGRDAQAQTQLGLPNLPTDFVSLPYNDDFEAYTGIVPTHFGINELNAATLAPEPLAWCNIGQNAPCIMPSSGSSNLEMGNVPNTSNFIDVLNALVIGLDGTGFTAEHGLRFLALDSGEENDPEDGVWVSDDGIDFFRLQDWSNLPDTSTWEEQTDLYLDSTPANVSGRFYLTFVQNDNFPYLDLDGIGIDDIEAGIKLHPPPLSVSPLNPREYAILRVDGAEPRVDVSFLASVTGPGPTNFGGATVALSPPIISIGTVNADDLGVAVITPLVPAKASNRTVWLQAIVHATSGPCPSEAVQTQVQ